MSDEFVTLAKSEEENIDKYLNALDRYLQERFSDQLKKESLLKKITKHIGSSWTFTTLYEKALKKSKKEKCKTILAYIDLLDETKNIDDQWINSDEIKQAIEKIRKRIKDKTTKYIKEQKRCWTTVKILYENKRENLKKSGQEKNEDGQSLEKIQQTIKKVDNMLQEIQKAIKKLNIEDEPLDIEQIKNELNYVISSKKNELRIDI
jgi:predicted RND superfamily exporter protein